MLPTYKYPSKLPHFLVPSHILTLLLIIPPYESPPFPSFFSLYFGVKRGQSWGKKMIGEQPS